MRRARCVSPGSSAGLSLAGSRRSRPRCYRAIDRPDLLVVLRVDPDLAVARRPEQDADFVRRRAAEVWDHDWSRTEAVVVDASLPQEDVIDAVHAAIWHAL